MKRFFWLFAAIIIASCSSKDDNVHLYETFGVVKEGTNASDKLYIRSDNGKAVLPSTAILKDEDKNRRVWVLFSTNSDVEKSDTIKAIIYDFLKITLMDFKTKLDSLQSDAVSLKKLWIAQNYLTMTIDASAGSEESLKNHKYTMYADSVEIARKDTVHMEFKYDRNSDAYTRMFNKVVTLQLDDKILVRADSVTTADSVVLAIKYRDGTGPDNVKYVTYKK